MESLSQYINNIQPKDKLNYLVVMTVSIWFFTHIYEANVSFLIAILVAISYSFYTEDKIRVLSGDLNSKLYNQLTSLLEEDDKSPPDNFHIEPDMISFFYSIKDFRKFNRDAYVRTINTANILLGIKKKLEYDYKYYETPGLESWQNFELTERDSVEKTNIKNYKQIFEIAEMTAHKSLNYMHSFIISLSSNKTYRKKHKNAMKRYNILVYRVLDDILRHAKEYSSMPEVIGLTHGKEKPYTDNEDELSKSFNFFYN